MNTLLPVVRSYGPDIPSANEAATGGLVRAGLSRIARVVRAWREHREDQRELEALLAVSDHVLQDIGVTRHAVLWAYRNGTTLRRTGR